MASISFSGMASGLDTDSIVEALLMNQQNKIDTQYKKQVSLTYKQDAWKSMNTKLNSFYKNYVDKMRLSGSYTANKASSSSSAISVSALSSAATGTHSFKNIKLASGVSATTSNISGVKVDVDTKLSDIGITTKTVLAVEKSDGTTKNIVVDPNSEDASSIKTLGQLSDALSAEGVDMSIKDDGTIALSSSSGATVKGGLLKKLGMSDSTIVVGSGETIGSQIGIINKKTSLTSLGVVAGGATATINLNGKDIEITSDDTIATLETKLKAADSSLNVSFDETSKKFLISTKETGASSVISIAGDNNVLNKLGLSSQTVMGENAKYTYNGTELESESNNISVNGLSVTLNRETTEDITVQVSRDTESMVSFVKDFVNAYNELLEEINTALTADKSGYSPYTETEESEATDDQKDKRKETLIKEALRGDSTLKTIRDNMRSVLQDVVGDNEFGSLSAIGITTGQWSENGKLYLDEEKLTAALEKNADDVIALFTSTKKSIEVNGKTVNAKGYMVNMDTSFRSMKSSIDQVRSYDSFYNDKSMTTDLKSIKSKMQTLKDRYESMKDIYYAKFTAMEKAISSINTQGNTISSYFST